MVQPDKKIVRHKRKRYKVNKVRFSLFCLTILSLLVMIGLCINALFNQDSLITATVSEDLIEVVDEQSFKVSLSWEQFDAKKYDQIDIMIDGVIVQTLNIADETFDFTTTKAEDEVKVKVIARRKGFGFDAKELVEIKTPKDNQKISQTIEQLQETETDYVMTQILKSTESLKEIKKSLSYEILSPSALQVETLKSTVVEEDANQIKIEIKIPKKIVENEVGLVILTSYEVDDVPLQIVLTGNEILENLKGDKTGDVSLNYENGNLLLINNKIKTVAYRDYYFYGETVQLIVDSEQQPTTYTLLANDNEIKDDYVVDDKTGIDLSALEPGKYSILLDNQYVTATELESSDVWYTVMREGIAREVKLMQQFGKVILVVNNVTSLPEDVYDIMIDAGHGGLDSGSIGYGGELFERDEVLKASQYMFERFKAHGLKVKMTREDEHDPAGEGNFEYTMSPYMDNGRVTQVYDYEPKYVVSNHLNALDGAQRGYQVYASVASSKMWSDLIASEFKALGHTAKDSLTSEYRVSPGVYKQSFICEPDGEYMLAGCLRDVTDYFYYIRETGGQFTHATSIAARNERYSQVPRYGAETILVEFAYLDNQEDSLLWLSEWESFSEAVVKATVDYLKIPYQSK